jgi:hypothetical protein
VFRVLIDRLILFYTYYPLDLAPRRRTTPTYLDYIIDQRD